jgi:TRAP-type uncharacterized transport system substrate-binding protein
MKFCKSFINLMLFGMFLIVFSPFAYSAENKDGKPVIRFCTGSKSGNYEMAGKEIARRLSNTFTFIPVRTSGADENIRKLVNGECDWAWTQRNVRNTLVLENPDWKTDIIMIRKVYKEGLHVVCNRASKVDRITDIPKRNLKMYGVADGTGTATTMRNLFGADDKLYKNVEKMPETGMEALNAVRDAEEGACYAFMAGLNTNLMQSANLMSINNPKRKPTLKLINVDDRDMMKLTDLEGKPMYEYMEIKRNNGWLDSGKPLYSNLLEDDVTIPFTDAEFIVNSSWKAQNKKYMDRIITAIEDASPTIYKVTNPVGQFK